MILKRVEPGDESSRARDARYDIHLQVGSQEGLLLGRTTSQVTHDLLQLLWNKGLYLPGTIFNLRIADVVTMARPGDAAEAIPEPWRSSRLWLGVSLYGTGDFKTRKRNGS